TRWSSCSVAMPEVRSAATITNAFARISNARLDPDNFHSTAFRRASMRAVSSGNGTEIRGAPRTEMVDDGWTGAESLQRGQGKDGKVAVQPLFPDAADALGFGGQAIAYP